MRAEELGDVQQKPKLIFVCSTGAYKGCRRKDKVTPKAWLNATRNWGLQNVPGECPHTGAVCVAGLAETLKGRLNRSKI